jgi:hypothetical protein
VNDPQFLTAAQLSKKYPAFSLASIRWVLFNRETNGFNSAVVQLGRKLLIDEQAFVAWLRSHKAVA